VVEEVPCLLPDSANPADQPNTLTTPPAAQSADGGEQRPGLGRADRDPAVDACRDGWGGPLDAVYGVGGEVVLLDGAAKGVVEHRPHAPLGRPGRCLPSQGADARVESQPDGGRAIQRGDRQQGAGRPVQGGGLRPLSAMP
jgi:hypothetical protein